LIRTERFEEVIGSDIDEWIYMFKTGEVKEGFKSKGMKAVKKKLDYLKMSKKERKTYDSYLMDLARENNIIETADQDGYIRGLKEAQKKIKEAQKREEEVLEKQKKTIIKFYLRGFTFKELSEDFEMSTEKIKEIIENNN